MITLFAECPAKCDSCIVDQDGQTTKCDNCEGNYNEITETKCYGILICSVLSCLRSILYFLQRCRYAVAVEAAYTVQHG